MKAKSSRLLLAILAVVLIILAMLAESVYFSDFEYQLRTKRLNSLVNSKVRILENCLNDMQPIIASKDHHGSNSENTLFSIAEKNNITILEYFDSKLNYWSDNGFDVPSELENQYFTEPLVFLQNGWFLAKRIESGNEVIIGLLRLHYDYGFENDIIKSGFAKGFRIPANVGLSADENASEYQIRDINGNFLFSLIFPLEKENSYYIIIPLILWFGAFLSLILLSLELVKVLVRRGRNRLSVSVLAILFALFYFVILLTGKPYILIQTELFTAYSFALNWIIPSLGHLLIAAILVSIFSTVCFRYYPNREEPGKELKSYVLLLFSFIIGALLLSLFHFLFSRLVSNSNINFETYKVLELDAFSMAGFVSAFLLFMMPVSFLIKVFQKYRPFKSSTILLSIIPSLIIIAVLFFKDTGTLIPLALFYILLSAGLWILIKMRIGMFNISVIFSMIFAIYMLYFITILSEERTIENLKVEAVSFSTENDPEAELLLLDIWPLMSTDSLLREMMQEETFNTNREDYDKISNYLQDTYFRGYWANFYFHIVLCRNSEPIRVGPGNEVFENCFNFFDERISIDGNRLTGTDFYFINNPSGRTYYLGRLFFIAGNDKINGLFIELYSDINVFQPGYSELLLDKRYHGYEGLRDYSVAKYINGQIVLRTGDFPFDKNDADYVDKATDYRLFNEGGFNHILYKNGNSTVIISRPGITFGDIIISFAYLFALILLFANLFILMIRRPAVGSLHILNFRQKLQLSYIGILLFSFILIGIVVAFITIGQYQLKHSDNIKEKLNSIYLELDGKLSMEEHLSAEWSDGRYGSLNELLVRLSNIFNTDINLYDVTGKLIETSRQEIFYRDLTSIRMNNMAYTNIAILKKSEYFQKEMIGKLEYLSAYVPFFRSDGELLAYLNLPYFRMQSVLAKEISNLIVAVINFTLLLIVITMGLAVFISGRLTSPLSMLGDGLASVEVGKKSEHLSYRGNDEIGELVKQYNRMVDEIEESTHKLANSEREYAWREMAKQIAHEIKNPLTPMKLNVQQLLKSWKDKIPDFGENIERFTRNQIEYIDNLSSIASAFSSFAKMPGTNPGEVNILDQLKITLELFKDTDNVTFSVQWPHESRVIVFADKEHLNGVFSNLLKNSIQSIPSGRAGLIKINFDIRGDKVIVAVSDNGTGIPDELQKKLFIPNFTTKSSGMGLGLSIVKKYIESANGRIWFESVADEGSVFYVELPLKYTVEKLG